MIKTTYSGPFSHGVNLAGHNLRKIQAKMSVNRPAGPRDRDAA
jgi:hypothetical protein